MVTFHRTADEALADVADGATVAVSGFGLAGQPTELIDALVRRQLRGLTIVANNAGNGDVGLARLLATGAVSKVVCSFPRQHDSHVFDRLYRAGDVELELVPQGSLAERLRAAGAGIAGFYTRTAAGTPLADTKETRVFDDHLHVFERALRVDVALIKGHRADRFGNVTYRKTARNFGPVMAMAAQCTIVQTTELCEAEPLDPETIITPSIFVDRVVHTPA